jgi:hypothetical protein
MRSSVLIIHESAVVCFQGVIEILKGEEQEPMRHVAQFVFMMM